MSLGLGLPISDLIRREKRKEGKLITGPDSLKLRCRRLRYWVPVYRVFPTLNEGHSCIRGVLTFVLLSRIEVGFLIIFVPSPPGREQPNQATRVQLEHWYRNINARFTTSLPQYHC